MLQFHPYGFLISLGILAGLVVVWWRKKLYGLTSDDLENLFLLIIPLGVVGARIYHVLDKWSYYSQNLGQIAAVWNGGLGIYGGVLGGLVGLGVFWRIKNFTSRKRTCSEQAFQILNLLDFLMPSLALGQAIGRWGNFFNQEVFGPPTNLPWKWFISENLRPEMWKNYEFFHPIFLYESLWVFLGFIILIILELSLRGVPHRTVRDDVAIFFSHKEDSHGPLRGPRNDKGRIGFLTGFYAVWYGLGRFFLEYLRFDTAEIWGIKTAQIISLGLIVFGIWQMKIIWRKRKI